MTSRYKTRFAELKAINCKAFMPFTVLGWPERTTSLNLIKQMIDSGVSALELGFAFSDPVADGPLIQQADYETLSQGFTVEQGLDLIKEIRDYDKDIPVGVLVYYNLVLAHGVERFFVDAAAAGIDGVLIADLPIDSAEEVAPYARANDIDLIYLVSPVTAGQRLDLITSKAAGFIYLLSRLGVTGTGQRSAANDRTLGALVQEIKNRTSVPVMAGFGISSPANAEAMYAAGVDGVITGSKVIEMAAKSGAAAHLEEFYREMLKVSSGDNTAKRK